MATGLTRTEEERKLQGRISQLKQDLADAGSPASLTVEVFGGGLSGWGITRLGYKGLEYALKVKDGEKPGFMKKNPKFIQGIVAGAVGLVSGVANLAIPYKFPLSYPRGMALQGSITMLTSGLDRIVDNFPTAPAKALPAAEQ